MDLRTALIPLYGVSKVCCLNAYTYRPFGVRCGRPAVTPNDNVGSRDAARRPVLSFSAVGIVHAVGCAAGYSAYHIHSSLSQSSKLTDPNLVRVAIDLKNQYIGCLLVLALVSMSLLRQPTLDALLRAFLRADGQLASIRAELLLLLPEATAAPPVTNAVWLRNVSAMVVLGVGVKAHLEVTNCLMYIRDSGSPFSSYCLVLCIVPQTLCVVAELQFVAYALLLRDRFAQLNRWLLRLQPALARGHDGAFRALARITTAHGELTGAIRLLNRSFGAQNAVLLLNQFVTLVELGYNTCMMVVRFDDADTQQGDTSEDFLETVTWVGWFVLEIFVLCYFSHRTVAEAQDTANLLQLPPDYGSSRRRHFRTASLEHVAFLNRKIAITCGGLFTVDLTLLYAIIGATSTYLIILIQFDQSVNVGA